MSQILQAFSAQFCKDKVPHLRPGYLVKVHQKIKEGNKERVQVFAGTVIKNNAGYATDSTFTVRKVSEGVGVEKTFPYHSPNIVKIEVQRAHKVRRSKLGYLRDRSGKALRMKEVDLDLEYKEFPKEAVKEEPKAEATEEAAAPAEEVAEAPVEETVEKAPEAAPEEKAEDPKKD